jgi:tripartite ATP-independent transporter DctM subunit
VTLAAVALLVLLIAGLPIAWAFGLAAIVALIHEQLGLLNVASKLFNGVNSFVLLAAPFYIVAGELMNRGGISDRLIRFSVLIVGRIRGGTAYAAVVASVLFAGISGTAIADIAALGQIFINSMPKEGYSKAFAAALVTAGSIIGPIIPPSVIMVLYAAVSDLSVLRLFLGGVVPGLLLGLACGLVIFVRGLRGELPRSSMAVAPAERPKAIRDGILVLTLPAFIVFGTLSGVFTPTEAGGVAVVYAIFLGVFVFRHLDRAGLFLAFRAAARLTAALFMLIATVEVFNYILIMGGIEDVTQKLLSVFKGHPYLFLIACVVAFLIIGLALDAGPALLLLAPVLLPLSRQMGIDDIHFSMVMIVSTTMGLISPPVGVCLFVACRIGEMSLRELWTELRWFFYAELGVVVLLVFVPAFSTALPNWLRP